MPASKLALAAASLALLGLVSFGSVSVGAMEPPLDTPELSAKIFSGIPLDEFPNVFRRAKDGSKKITQFGRVSANELLSVIWTEGRAQMTLSDLVEKCFVENYQKKKAVYDQVGYTTRITDYIERHLTKMLNDCIAHQRPILNHLILESGVRYLVVAYFGTLELNLGQNDLRKSAKDAWAGLDAKMKERKQEETEQGKKTKEVGEIREELKAACRKLFDRMEGRILEQQFVEQDQLVVFCEIALGKNRAPAMGPIRRPSK
jgi:hypothetical protein